MIHSRVIIHLCTVLHGTYVSHNHSVMYSLCQLIGTRWYVCVPCKHKAQLFDVIFIVLNDPYII